MRIFLQELWNKIVEGKYQIFGFIAVLVVGYFLIRLISWIIRKSMARTKADPAVNNFVVQVVKVLLSIVYIIILCTMLGIPTTSLIALFSAGALGISLALQSSISNLASGFLLIYNHPFKSGDFIEAGGVSGTVQTINMMTTVMITPDNKVITLPNNTVMGSNIINFSKQRERRVDLTVSVAYGSDVEQVKTIINSTVTKHEMVLGNRDITVRLNQMNASSLDFAVRVWTKKENYWNVYFDLNENILAALNENGISVPFPQLDVHLLSNEKGES